MGPSKRDAHARTCRAFWALTGQGWGWGGRAHACRTSARTAALYASNASFFFPPCLPLSLHSRSIDSAQCHEYRSSFSGRPGSGNGQTGNSAAGWAGMFRSTDRAGCIQHAQGPGVLLYACPPRMLPPRPSYASSLARPVCPARLPAEALASPSPALREPFAVTSHDGKPDSSGAGAPAPQSDDQAAQSRRNGAGTRPCPSSSFFSLRLPSSPFFALSKDASESRGFRPRSHTDLQRGDAGGRRPLEPMLNCVGWCCCPFAPGAACLIVCSTPASSIHAESCPNPARIQPGSRPDPARILGSRPKFLTPAPPFYARPSMFLSCSLVV